MSARVRFPRPLRPGDLVAVTAPSAGVGPALHARLDGVIAQLRGRGLRVVEGACLRESRKHVSASRERRAGELMAFLADPGVAAVMPPWGGELAIELLPLLDFEALGRLAPKWFSGFSDLSTLQLPLLLRAGWASLHGPNLMELVAAQTDATTAAVWRALETPPGASFEQRSSATWQAAASADWADQPETAFALTEPTRCRRLDGDAAPVSLRGRLAGGCLDTIARLAGTPCGDLRTFAAALPAGERTIVFLENAEMAPLEVARALYTLRLAGWFERAAGVLVGRSLGPEAAGGAALQYAEALRLALGDLGLPVLVDVDIGHRPPQWSLVQGALAEVEFTENGVRLSQALAPLVDNS